jgi:serine/threonine protein kinase
MPEAVHPDLIAQRYEVQDLIGTGGLAFVFRGWDHREQRAVAIKWLKRTDEESEQEERMAEQLWREAMSLGALDHPNIVSLLDFGVEEEGAFVVTELIEGETLEAALQRGPFLLEDFVLFADEALQGLGAAHRVHLVHRDINPGNFILEPSPFKAFRVRILDFGLAKFIHKPQPQTLDHQNSLMGSIHYVSPEQFQRQPLDQRTDLYALGCICYEMVTGHEAFQGKTVMDIMNGHLERQARPIGELRHGVSQALRDWVMKMMAKVPDERFADVTAARAALLSSPEGLSYRPADAELGAV